MSMTAIFAAVCAGLAYAGVAVDGDEGELAVGGSDDLVTGDAAFGDRGKNGAADGINDGEALRTLLCDEQTGL